MKRCGTDNCDIQVESRKEIRMTKIDSISDFTWTFLSFCYLGTFRQGVVADAGEGIVSCFSEHLACISGGSRGGASGARAPTLVARRGRSSGDRGR